MANAGSSPGSVLGLVLAAGRSSRTGFPKALGLIDGESLVGRAVRLLREAGVARVVVVVAPPHEEAIRAALGDALLARNPAPERGMLSSVQVGLRAGLAALPNATAVVVALVDHPRVRPSTVAALIAARAEDDAPSVRPHHAGRGGHPVVLARRVAEAVLDAEPGATLRDLLEAAGGPRDVQVEDPSVLEDLDTPEALERAGVQAPIPDKYQ